MKAEAVEVQNTHSLYQYPILRRNARLLFTLNHKT
jgi:hypothetical protein